MYGNGAMIDMRNIHEELYLTHMDLRWVTEELSEVVEPTTTNWVQPIVTCQILLRGVIIEASASASLLLANPT